MRNIVIVLILCPLLGFGQITSKSALAAFRGDRDYIGAFIPETLDVVRIANHRLGADVSVDYNTDAYLTQIEMLYAEAAHFKYNLGFTIFDNTTFVSTATTAQRDSLKNGQRADWSVYFNLESWNEIDTSTLRTLINSVKTPLSGYGNLVAASYSSGDTSGVARLIEMKAFLGGRLAQSGSPTATDFNSFYGFDVESGDTLGEILVGDGSVHDIGFTMRRRIVSRFNNTGGWTFGDSTATASNATSAAGLLGRAINKAGFYMNFTHFHDLYAPSTTDYRNSYFGFLKKQRDTLDARGAFAFSGGYGDIFEYTFAKTLVDTFYLVKGENGYRIDITYQSNSTINEALISVPVSYQIVLTGTELQGEDISCDGCTGIRKINTDTFALDIPISESSVSIATTASPDYYDFELPELLSAAYNSGTGVLTITSDKPVRASVFHGTRNGTGPWDIWGALRTTSFSTTHAVNISGIVANDLYIGLITEEKQSILSNVYRF